MSKACTVTLLVFAIEAVVLLGGCAKPAAVGPADEPSPASSSIPPAKIPTPLLPPPGQASDAAGPARTSVSPSFRALGTEPFWSATYARGKVTWSTPEQPDGVTVPVNRADADGQATLTGKLDGRIFELQVRQEPCSDGMSDAVYPLSVVRRIGDDTKAGCAR